MALVSTGGSWWIPLCAKFKPAMCLGIEIQYSNSKFEFDSKLWKFLRKLPLSIQPVSRRSLQFQPEHFGSNEVRSRKIRVEFLDFAGSLGGSLSGSLSTYSLAMFNTLCIISLGPIIVSSQHHPLCSLYSLDDRS